VADTTSETILRAARGARLVVLTHRDEPGHADLAAALAANTRLPLLLIKSNGALPGTASPLETDS
jgi:hypothetical protein